jgi:hypothetical protein
MKTTARRPLACKTCPTGTTPRPALLPLLQNSTVPPLCCTGPVSDSRHLPATTWFVQAATAMFKPACRRHTLPLLEHWCCQLQRLQCLCCGGPAACHAISLLTRTCHSAAQQPVCQLPPTAALQPLSRNLPNSSACSGATPPRQSRCQQLGRLPHCCTGPVTRLPPASSCRCCAVLPAAAGSLACGA